MESTYKINFSKSRATECYLNKKGKPVEKERKLFIDSKGVFVIRKFKRQYMHRDICEVVW